jgi:hypothetical protein
MADIFLLAGAPAVGKSSTAKALAAHFPKSIHIPVDSLREMVISDVIHPGGTWSAELVEQLSLGRGTAVEMARRYRAAGFVVVIDDFWDPNSQLHEYDPIFSEPGVHKMLLLPNQQAAQQRNLQRAGEGESSRYITEGIRSVYARLEKEVSNLEAQGWIIVDTTERDIDSTVKHILEISTHM